jgi:peptide/nickel transport system substrate-binding protein
MLAALVAQGKLPAVEERLPIMEDAYIIAPPDEIGVYGGIMQLTAHYSPGWAGLIEGGCVRMGASGVDHIPGICKSFDISSDGRVYTFKLRQGARWSDGFPVTTEDFRFAWEDLHSNLEFKPQFDSTYLDKITGNPAEFNQIDDYTWTLTFDSPNYTILEEKANILHLCYGRMSECYYTPAHYAKNYHADYITKAQMDALMKADDFGTWKEVFSKYNASHLGDIEIFRNMPIMGSFVMMDKTDSSVTTERNPYFPGVDPQGNQLPYLDGVVGQVVESREVGAFRSMSGELDFGSHSLALSELPLYRSNMVAGDYSIVFWVDPGGCSYCTWVNQTYNEDKEVAMWLRTPDFRKALSLATDRNNMSEVVVLGLGVPQNWLPHPSIPYYPGDEWQLLDATLDVPRAKQILDGLGLVDTNGDGFRDRKDGTGNLELFYNTTRSGFKMIEIMKQDFGDIGIMLNIKEAPSRGISSDTEYFSMGNTLYEANPWGTYWSRMAPTYSSSALGPAIGRWYSTRGKEGMAPTGPNPDYLPLAPADAFPADSTGLLTELLDKWNSGHGLAATDPARIELGKDLYRKNAEAKYTINIVGFAGHPTRSLHIQRNNFRNAPQNHFPATDSRFYSLYSFEDGTDNINHPGNRSKLYKSTSFLD